MLTAAVQGLVRSTFTALTRVLGAENGSFALYKNKKKNSLTAKGEIMEIGKIYTIEVTGKIVKRELYKDGKIRAWVQNDETNEMAIIVENEKNIVTEAHS